LRESRFGLLSSEFIWVSYLVEWFREITTLTLGAQLIEEETIVSIVTPISGIDIDLTNIRSWLVQTQHLAINTILIHDEVDPNLQVKIEHLLEELRNPRITLHRGHFGSPGAARNKGLEFVNSERVVFWDSDDIGDPHSLIKVINEYKDSKIIVGSFTINSDFSVRDQTSMLLEDDDTLEIRLGINPGIWRYVFNCKTIGSTRFSEFRMGEDQQFLVQIQAIPTLVSVTETVLYNYFTGNETHLTSQKSAKAEVFYSFMEIQSIFRKRSKKMNLFETTIYLKLLWSTFKYSGKLKSLNAIIASLRLIVLLRRIVIRNLIRIIVFAVRQNKDTTNET
jgi:glycosyltransferase involved in cell wall biosynthesis